MIRITYMKRGKNEAISGGRLSLDCWSQGSWHLFHDNPWNHYIKGFFTLFPWIKTFHHVPTSNGKSKWKRKWRMGRRKEWNIWMGRKGEHNFFPKHCHYYLTICRSVCKCYLSPRKILVDAGPADAKAFQHTSGRPVRRAEARAPADRAIASLCRVLFGEWKYFWKKSRTHFWNWKCFGDSSCGSMFVML